MRISPLLLRNDGHHEPDDFRILSKMVDRAERCLLPAVFQNLDANTVCPVSSAKLYSPPYALLEKSGDDHVMATCSCKTESHDQMSCSSRKIVVSRPCAPAASASKQPKPKRCSCPITPTVINLARPPSLLTCSTHHSLCLFKTARSINMRAPSPSSQNSGTQDRCPDFCLQNIVRYIHDGPVPETQLQEAHVLLC
jgi:hypothetical protein